jgi:hypothetical protein
VRLGGKGRHRVVRPIASGQELFPATTGDAVDGPVLPEKR